MSDSVTGHVPSLEPTPERFRRVAAGIADIGDDAETPAGAAAGVPVSPDPGNVIPIDQPWKTIDVDGYMDMAGVVLKLPFKQLARVTGEPQWQLENEELADLEGPLRNALQKLVWDIKMAKYVSNPYLSLIVAIGGLAVVKYGFIKVNPTPPEQSQHQAAPPPGPRNHQSTPPVSTAQSGRTRRSGGEFLFADPQGAASQPSFDNGSEDADE